jgi:hypothetical protein
MPALRSSNLASAEYDDQRSVLILEFLDGSTYEYEAVPPQVYQGLLAAPSPGKYAFANIYNRYLSNKVF